LKSVYEITREKLLERLREVKDPGQIDSSEIDITSYNASDIPPQPKHSLPDVISKSVTVFPEPVALTISVPSVQVKTESSLRVPIAVLRDNINSLTKIREGWKFRLLEIHEERAIIDIYKACDSEEEFVLRLAALRNLISWMNVDAMKRIVNDGINREGSINWLEALLDKEFGELNTEKIIKKLRCLINLASGYPFHVDNERVLEAYRELGINRPISDYRGVWEKILNAYRESLRELVNLLTGGKI